MRRGFLSWILLLVAACSSAEFKPASVGPSSPDEEAVPEDEDDESSQRPKKKKDAGGDDDDDDVDEPQIEEDAGGALPMSSNVTIQVQPTDSGAAILAAIRGAKKSVHMTMYLLTDDDIVDALGDAKQAGRDVKVVLNRTFPPYGGDNEPKFNALESRGVDVQWAPGGYTFTHAKTILIDSEKALIMTMNLTESSARTNREYIATDADPADVADLETIFAADFANKSVNVTSKLVVSPAGANTLTPRNHLKALIATAKSSLDVEVQSLSDTSLVDAIVHAHESNVDVHVVIDGDTANSTGQTRAIAKLKERGVPLRSLKSPDVHAKAIVVDRSRMFIGSHNFTPTALDQNREIGVLTDAQTEALKVHDVIANDFTKGTPL